MAENDNTIKRYKKEIESTRGFAISKFAKDMLEIRDNLQMATKYTDIKEEATQEEVTKQLKDVGDGVKMTSKQFDNVMKRFNVVEFDPTGEKFDPSSHEACFTVPDESKDPNTVHSVIQTGWKIGERVLRAAKVGVVKK